MGGCGGTAAAGRGTAAGAGACCDWANEANGETGSATEAAANADCLRKSRRGWFLIMRNSVRRAGRCWIAILRRGRNKP